MERVSSKDILIVVIGMIITLFFALTLQINKFSLIELELGGIMYILTIITPIILGVVIVIYIKLREIDRELENQKLEQKKLEEKLKIYERLAIIEKRLFENGNKS